MRRLKILVHHRSWMGENFPGMPDGYELSHDPSQAPEADIVLFHIPTLRSIAINKYTNQLWVGWSLETEENYPLMKILRARGRGYFDLWMTHHQDSKIWCPYFDANISQRLLATDPLPNPYSAAAYFASNENDQWGRKRYVQELMAHTRVDSYGKSLNNRPLLEDQGPNTKMRTIASYRFTLAFENTLSRDYVTEKFFEPLLAGSIPIYRGAPNVEDFAPGENCFINANKFEDPHELALHLNRISRDERLCAEFHQWRGRPLREGFRAMLERVRLHVFDRLREHYERRFGNQAPSRAVLRRFQHST